MRISTVSISWAMLGIDNAKAHCAILVTPDVMAPDKKPLPARFLEAEAERQRIRLRESVADLAHYLEKMSGAPVDVLTGDLPAGDARVPILIAARAAAVFGPPGKSAPYKQGFRMVVSPKGVGLLGESDLASSYAIFELLDRLGCRWYMPSEMGEVIPELKTITLKEIERFDKILLSPGPGIPSEAGLLLDLIKMYAPTKSILGVCLGQQAIAEAFGGSLINLDKVFHGLATPIEIIKDDVLFKGLPKKFNAGRYHSWVVNPKDLPSELEVTALDENGQIMALRHKKYKVHAVQFHPESVLTEHGEEMIRNWINS